MKKETFLEGIQFLQDSRFPGNHEFTDSEKKTWWVCLMDLDGIPFLDAVKACIMTSEFFPTIAQIRKKSIGEPVMSAEQAWAEVLEQKMDTCGTENVAVFSSKVIADIVDNYGGLDRIWLAGVEKEGYFRKIFIAAFNSQQAKEKNSLMVGNSQKVIDDGE